jgi:hypothetical protein
MQRKQRQRGRLGADLRAPMAPPGASRQPSPNEFFQEPASGQPLDFDIRERTRHDRKSLLTGLSILFLAPKRLHTKRWTEESGHYRLLQYLQTLACRPTPRFAELRMPP